MIKHTAVTFLIVVALISSDLNAQGRSDDDFHDYGMSSYGLFVSATTIASAIFLLGNIRNITIDNKSSATWETGGWISGTLSLLVGVLSLAESFDDVNKDTQRTIGLVSTMGGAMTIGATIWASKLTRKEEQKLSISPMVIPDSQGRLAMGLGVQFVGW